MQQNRSLARPDRLALILQRDGPECVWCRKPLALPNDPRAGRTRARATTDHVVPRLKGGPSWIENEVAACGRCNRTRGHRSPAVWLDECERRGDKPNRQAVAAALQALDTAIATNGGQRRARAYVATQLRRLAKAGR